MLSTISDILFAATDYDGQRMQDNFMWYLSILSMVMSYIWGYYKSWFSETIIVFATCVGIISLICIPSWPFFRKQKLEFLSPYKESQAYKDAQAKE